MTSLRAAAIAVVVAGAAAGAAAQTPTPTPRPKLSGGFGRPQAAPAPVPTASGQSLRDVVKAAAEQRQAKAPGAPTPVVAINNQTLVTDPNRGRLTVLSSPPPRPAGGHAAPPSAAAASAAKAPTPTPAEDPAVAEEEKWKEIARQTRQRVADSQERVARLEGETKKLENDFYSWDDGLYRDNVIKPAWDKKREELETARRDLEAAEKDLADLPEKARKAGALPGWIRE
ncbi:MAG TPA: hypothetical protein VIA45_09530 [Thermoanaerobaculia bacterium]|jgi:hypothetical protein